MKKDSHCPRASKGTINGSHEIFIWSWDAFTTTWSITDDTTTTDTFADVEPKHHFETNESIQSELLEKKE